MMGQAKPIYPTYREPLVTPSYELKVAGQEMLDHDRWVAGFYQSHFQENERKLRMLRSVPPGDFIPEELLRCGMPDE